MVEEIKPLSRDLWMPDSSARTCMKCEKGFNTFRRRHHCRYCGLIFCSTCIRPRQHIPHGPEIELNCDSCYQLISRQFAPRRSIDFRHNSEYARIGASPTKILTNELISTISERPEPVHDSEMLSDASEELSPPNRLLESMQVEAADQEILNSFLIQRIKTVAEKAQVNTDWHSIIFNFIQQAVRYVVPSVHYRHDTMNINNYLRIITVTWKDMSLCDFVNGVVFFKNVAHKRMNKNIEGPRILLLSGGTEYQSCENKFISMDTLLDQEDQYTKILIKKITDAGANLVIVEKNMPQEVIKELERLQITAIINVKKKILDMIARVSDGVVLNSINQTYHQNHFIGTCKAFFIKQLPSLSLAYLQEVEDSILGGTIILSGPSKQELKKVKGIVRELVIEYRNAVIELKLLKDIGVMIHDSLIDELACSYTKLRHLTITDRQCGKPNYQKIDFYTEADKALGEFIVRLCKKAMKKCDKEDCNKVNIEHDLYFFKANGRVKMKLEKSEIPLDFAEPHTILLLKKCRLCNKRHEVQTTLNTYSWEYSLYKFINNFFHTIPLRHANHKCEHDFFKDGLFIFESEEIKIECFYESNPTYELVNLNTHTRVQSYYDNLLKQTFDDFLVSSKEVLAMIQDSTFDAKRNLYREEQLEDNRPYLKSFEILKEELEQGVYQIGVTLERLTDMDISQFKNHLEIETQRREIFIQACRLKVMLENIPVNIRRLKNGGEVLALDFSKSRSVSMMEDMTGHTSYSDYPERLSLQSSNSVIYAKLLEPLDKEDYFLSSAPFLYLQRGSLALPLGKGALCIPVDENDSLSIIAYALNNEKYYSEVVDQLSLQDGLQDPIESELLSGSEQHFSFSISSHEIESIDSRSLIDMPRLYGPLITYHVISYFSRQFHTLRLTCCGSHLDFILSIARGLSKQVQLGKSGASFMYSHDMRFIIKSLGEREFRMFMELAPNYFRHICKSFFHDMPSRLVRILGAFRISVKNHTTGKQRVEWLILSENLGYNIPEKLLKYDLKGTFNQRRYVKDGDIKTKMDLNYLEDFKGLPITIIMDTKRLLDAAIWNDSLFLSKQNVIDYSMLVLVNEETKQIAAGIIDYIEQYTFEKAIESKYKTVMANETPTITNPLEYKKRFRTRMMQDFFIGIED